MLKVKINADKMDTRKRRERAVSLQREMEKVLNSDVFKAQVLKMPHMAGELSHLKELTRLEIYEYLMAGKEWYNEEEFGTLEAWLNDYYTWKSVYGYMTRGSKYINVNTKYFDTMSNKKAGSLIVHEWSHHLGASHHFRRTNVRHLSLSYLLNVAYENAHDIVFGNITAPTKKRYCRRPWRFLGLKQVCWYE